VYGSQGAYSDSEDYCIKVTLSGGPTATPTPTGTRTTTITPTGTRTTTCTPTATSTLTTTIPCPTDDYEPNGSFSTAYGPIDPGTAYCGGYICPSGDEDWFSFTVTVGQQFTVTLDSLPADFILQLLSPLQESLEFSQNDGTMAEQIVHTARMTGEYRARVYGFLGEYDGADDYCLTVTLGGEPPAGERLFLPLVLKNWP
jgi:hypothetical protein